MFAFRCFLSSLCGTGLLALNSLGQIQTAGSTAPVERVQVESVTKVFIAKNSPAYLVSFSYDFGKMSNIHIRGLGVLPSRGAYQYVSREGELEFLDPSGDVLLERIPLKETIVVAAKPPLNEVPSESEFPPAYRSYVWDLRAPLQERANVVLGKYFNYLPHENGKLTYLATTYTQLPLSKELADSGVQARLALLLSFPFDSATGKYSFHVQSLAKEGRALSDELRPTNNLEILAKANDFVDMIVTKMMPGK